MNRFKKELKRHGVMLEHDYPYLPYEEKGGVSLDSVIVNSEKATVTHVYNVIVLTHCYGRDFSVVEQDFD